MISLHDALRACAIRRVRSQSSSARSTSNYHSAAPPGTVNPLALCADAHAPSALPDEAVPPRSRSSGIPLAASILICPHAGHWCRHALANIDWAAPRRLALRVFAGAFAPPAAHGAWKVNWAAASAGPPLLRVFRRPAKPLRVLAGARLHTLRSVVPALAAARKVVCFAPWAAGVAPALAAQPRSARRRGATFSGLRAWRHQWLRPRGGRCAWARSHHRRGRSNTRGHVTALTAS